MEWRRWPALAALACGALVAPSSAQRPTNDSTRFVVLGHIRGDRNGVNPRLAELLDEVRRLRPAFAVLTGDIIWGDVDQPRADPATIRREWETVDSALAGLGIPIYRVPGNHDINDVPTRDVWIERYGPLPAAVTVGRLRLLLLSSAFIPPDGDTLHHTYVRGVDLDSAQVAWLADELTRAGSYDHVFAFMHHLLWWEGPDGRWWSEVHPLLARAGIPAVFSGDYGPLKFSTVERDGVRYYQSSIEVPVALALLQNRISSRVLSAQFDNFFSVDVVGSRVDVAVRTVGELTSGEFEPDRYRAINTPPPPPELPVWRRVWDIIGSPARLAALGGLVLLSFGVGYFAGRRKQAPLIAGSR